jgi:hypothetical protein
MARASGIDETDSHKAGEGGGERGASRGGRKTSYEWRIASNEFGEKGRAGMGWRRG